MKFNRIIPLIPLIGLLYLSVAEWHEEDTLFMILSAFIQSISLITLIALLS